jgi:hypothetical protein
MRDAGGVGDSAFYGHVGAPAVAGVALADRPAGLESSAVAARGYSPSFCKPSSGCGHEVVRSSPHARGGLALTPAPAPNPPLGEATFGPRFKFAVASALAWGLRFSHRRTPS